MSPMKRYGRRAVALTRAGLRQAVYRVHGLLHDTVTIQTRQGRLTMSTHDDGIAAALYRWRHYEFDYSIHAVRFLKDAGFLPRERARMCDVGANIGVISTGLLLANEIESAIAIEPEPKNFGLLMRNVTQNGLTQRMLCLQLAVGETEAILTMELSPDNPGDHRIRATPTASAIERQNESARQTVQVQSLPLKQIVERADVRAASPTSPSLLWIDVQGYEGYVFAGGRDVLGAAMPAVSEIWPYGIQRSGMSLEQFESTVSSIWSDYWIYRRERFIRYPMSVFGRFLDELGSDGFFENVIFTKGTPATPRHWPAGGAR
jgi:FkbM family methyltransferase